MDTQDSILSQIKAFEAHYHYDASYQAELLKGAPEGFAAFHQAQGLSSHRRSLPLEAHFVARVTAMRAEDCGACTQLNVRMALEQGVDPELLKALLNSPHELPESLKRVEQYVKQVLGSEKLVQEDLLDSLRADFGQQGLLELALCITGCRIFTTFKKALLKNRSCQIVRVEV